MRVLIAGGTGVVGQQLIPVLSEAGHVVSVLARSLNRANFAVAAGAKFLQADALDPKRVFAAVQTAQPDAIVNLLTAIPQDPNPKKLAADFALTNQLRTEGTRNLVEAAKVVGCTKLISESIAFAYAPSPQRVVTEDAPLWHNGPPQFRPIVAAIQELEQLTLEAGGTVLRFGHLYGPGTSFAPDGVIIQRLRERALPLVGQGTAVFSFLHTRDAAQAVSTALSYEKPGIFNIVDDKPAEVHSWLPALARTARAPEPKHVPVVLARLFVGAWGVAYMTKLRGASNTRAQDVLGWKPHFKNWQDGFEHEFFSPSTQLASN